MQQRKREGGRKRYEGNSIGRMGGGSNGRKRKGEREEKGRIERVNGRQEEGIVMVVVVVKLMMVKA